MNVKKPRQLRTPIFEPFKAELHRSSKLPHIYVGRRGLHVTPEIARQLGRWLLDYSAWAKSLEREFDERNE